MSDEKVNDVRRFLGAGSEEAFPSAVIVAALDRWPGVHPRGIAGWLIEQRRFPSVEGETQ